MAIPRPRPDGKVTRAPALAPVTPSTQRIVLPAKVAQSGKLGMASTMSGELSMGTLNLPVGMILRALPPEVLTGDIASFEASGAAATEIGLPTAMILSQLPSGKVEVAVQELISHFPPGFLRPEAEIASHLPVLISLPLMDVVMRIPPDLLSLRPDQKGVDASVINMADPFTEETLRGQAAAPPKSSLRAKSQPLLKPAPVLTTQPAAAAKPFIPPPPRPPSVPLPTRSSPPLTTGTKVLPPAPLRVPAPAADLPPPSPLSSRPAIPRPAANFTPLPIQPPPPEPAPAPIEKPPAPVPPVSDAAEADNLQRLAALAMAQLGDNDEEQPAEAEPVAPVASGVIPAAAEQAVAAAPPVAPTPPAVAAPGPSTALNLNTCSVAELLLIPGCTAMLAEAIVRHRDKIGSFRNLEQLFEVPGMNRAAYATLTGETAPEAHFAQSLNELLGFPPGQTVSLKDVTDRISCWPDVIGCVLSQSSGLSLVGTVPEGLDKAAIVAFAPRMFEAINKSLVEITGKPSDELIIPVPGMSFHILRHKDLYLIILCRLPQMPERHLKVARYVLAGLSLRPQ